LPKRSTWLPGMRTEKSPTRMDCSAFKRSCSSGDAPPLTRLAGISAGTALGDGPLALSSPTGSLFGCIVSSGADEPAHDVTGAGAVPGQYGDAAAIFGHPGLSERSLGTGDWNGTCPPPAAAACAPQRSTARPLRRRAIQRPCAEECLSTGWIRPCLYTPRCVQVGPPPDAPNAATLQWFREPGSKFLPQKTSMNFTGLEPMATAWREGEGPPSRAEVHS